MVTIWVDADACPGVVKDLIIRAAHKRQVQAIFVANKPLNLESSPWVSRVHVEQGPDVADQYIVDQAVETDLVISQDIPLAGALVPKGIPVISPYGTLFTPSNIGERLSVRNFMQDLRDAGATTAGPKPFSDKDKQRFANAFDQVLTKQLNRVQPRN